MKRLRLSPPPYDSSAVSIDNHYRTIYRSGFVNTSASNVPSDIAKTFAVAVRLPGSSRTRFGGFGFFLSCCAAAGQGTLACRCPAGSAVASSGANAAVNPDHSPLNPRSGQPPDTVNHAQRSHPVSNHIPSETNERRYRGEAHAKATKLVV